MCKECDDKGMTIVRKYENEIPYDYFYRCICEIGNKYRSWPYLDGTYEKKLEPIVKNFKGSNRPHYYGD